MLIDTTKQEGSGIGLSLSRQIMLAHHGSISCHNNDMGGASFRLIFKS
ncbi:ATP-binding protein [Paremcibacter congregatus]